MKCPGCDVEIADEDLRAQAEHMTREHPEIIEQRRTEAARWDGWEND